MSAIGQYDVYRSGQINGQGPVYYMFRMYRPDGSFGACSCVEEKDVAANREALIKMGYTGKPQ